LKKRLAILLFRRSYTTMLSTTSGWEIWIRTRRSHSPGRTRYPQARRLLITADCGGSNGARVRLWKRELQALANELGLSITV
jgi:hypothetical protein